MQLLWVVALLVFLGASGVYVWFQLVCPWREQLAFRALGARSGLTYVGRRVLGVRRSGRVFGTYCERACAVESHSEPFQGVLRIVCSLENPSERSFRVMAAVGELGELAATEGNSARQLWIAESTPTGFAERALVQAGIAERVPGAAAGLRSAAYQLSLAGHLLRFECQSARLCAMPVTHVADVLHAVLDALCVCAGELERMAPDPRAGRA